MRMARPALVLLLAMLASAPAFAADADAECPSIADPAARLACWDRLHPPVAAGAGAAPVAAAPSAREAFGLTAGQRLQREGRGDEAPEQISATVASVTLQRDRRRRVEFEDGQVWVLPAAGSRDRVEPGDRVEIRQAALGSYLLRTEAGIDVRAKRVR